LVVHNNYSSRVPSGENLAVHDETTWLRAAGVEVVAHETHNDDVVGDGSGGAGRRVRQAAEAVWSVSEQRRLDRALVEHRPDLVHVHNLFPLLSASVPWRAGRRGLPVVWTVHNRRVRCVAGTNFRDGRPCEDCRPGWRAPGVRHACYGGSTAASALVTVSSSLFAGLARRRVHAVAISGAVKRWLVDTGGFAADRVTVKYNGVEVATPPGAGVPPDRCRDVVYVGHLGAHKGVPLLLDAWRRADLPAGHGLHLAGDGDLAGEVRAAAAADPRITWHGSLPPDEVHALMSGARAVVVPSLWQEPFGRVAAEAMACGRPVVTTGIAGLAEVVDDGCGWVTGDDPGALAAALVDAATDDAGVARRGEATARRHRERFSPTATTRALLDIYERCLEGQPSG
jgi:glycosyltransferase involved in cell wall biosynthesis